MYQIRVDEALRLLCPGDVIATAAYFHEPQEFLSKLHLAASVSDLTLWTVNHLRDYPIVQDDCGKITWLSTFFDRNARKAQLNKQATYVPTDLHRIGETMVMSCRPTVFVAAVPPMEEDGTFCISTSLQWEAECLEAADRIILEVNPNIPHTDSGLRIPASRAACIYYTDSPPPMRQTGPVSEEEQRIAGYVAELIQDGDCIQFGLGGTPDAVANALMEKRDLGIHTEMLGTGMIRLIKAGVVTNRKKTLHPGKTVCAFSLGDQEAIDFLNYNHDVLFLPASYVNNPFTIAKNDNMVSINTAIQIDLLSQVCSEAIGGRQYSGAGGAMDFAYGATHAKGGRSIIALNATAKNGTLSRISAVLPAGSPVTIPRNTVDYVVTEFGVAKLRGASVKKRTEELIAIAHPDFRKELKQEAEKLMLW